MNQDKIISKIKKLLSLATSSNESEAKSAYSKAMELMIKHQIESLPSDKREIEENVRIIGGRESQEAKYVSMIIVSCFFAAIHKGRRWDEESQKVVTTFKFIAEKGNLEIALFAYDFLCAEFKRLWTQYKEVFDHMRLSEKERQTYYLGLTRGFKDAFREQKNYSENKYGLVVTSEDPDVQDYINEHYKNIKPDRPNLKCGRRDILWDGMGDGANIKISRVIEENKNSGQTLQLSQMEVA